MDRFASRQWLIDNLDLLLIEAAYHRLHEDVEQLEGVVIWSGTTEDEGRGSASSSED
jgi:hypothetical protein